MADTVFGIRSLRLYELLGAPLTAMIRADAEAAKTTLEYIETVGFEEGEPQTDEQPETESRLRMASFRYRKLDENNEYTEFETSVPLLSLVPIPALQIKEGKVKLTAKITDVVEEGPTNRQVVRAAGALRPSTALIGVLEPSRVQLLTKPAATSGSKETETHEAFHLEIEVTMTQADIPLGLERLFNVMDQAIREEKVEE